MMMPRLPRLAPSSSSGRFPRVTAELTLVLERSISDASGKMEITSVAKGALEKKMLDTNDVFLLDTGTEVYVWIGKVRADPPPLAMMSACVV